MDLVAEIENYMDEEYGEVPPVHTLGSVARAAHSVLKIINRFRKNKLDLSSYTTPYYHPDHFIIMPSDLGDHDPIYTLVHEYMHGFTIPRMNWILESDELKGHVLDGELLTVNKDTVEKFTLYKSLEEGVCVFAANAILQDLYLRGAYEDPIGFAMENHYSLFEGRNADTTERTPLNFEYAFDLLRMSDEVVRDYLESIGHEDTGEFSEKNLREGLGRPPRYNPGFEANLDSTQSIPYRMGYLYIRLLSESEGMDGPSAIRAAMFQPPKDFISFYQAIQTMSLEQT